MTKQKLAALPMKHQPSPTVLTSTAATAGPMTRATLTAVLFRVTALRIRSRPTTSATKACRAGLSTALKVPNTSARTTIWSRSTIPLSTRMPSARETRPSPAWVTSRTRRLGNRSTSRPAYGDSSSTGANRAAVVSPRTTPE